MHMHGVTAYLFVVGYLDLRNKLPGGVSRSTWSEALDLQRERFDTTV